MLICVSEAYIEKEYSISPMSNEETQIQQRKNMKIEHAFAKTTRTEKELEMVKILKLATTTTAK